MTDLPTPNITQQYILQQYDRSCNTRTQHNRIYYSNMTDLPTPNITQQYILQQYDRSTNTGHIVVYILRLWPNFNTEDRHIVVHITTIWPILQHRTQHNRIYYNNMTDLATPNTTQPYILQQYDRSSNTEHNTTVYITTTWPILQHRTQHNRIYYNNMTDLATPNTTQPYILRLCYDRSSNTEHNTTVYITTTWPILQHRTQHNRNITTIWPILQHRTQHNRIYYNNITDLATPNTTQPYILQQYDRSSNTEHNTTVYITTTWPILQHRTQYNRIYYNNMTDVHRTQHNRHITIYTVVLCSVLTDLPTPNTKETITTIPPIFQHRTQHNRIYYNNMTDLPTPNTTQPYILQQYHRSSNTEHNTTVYITTTWPIFQHRTQNKRKYYNNITDLPTPNTTQPYILQQHDRSCNTVTVYITTNDRSSNTEHNCITTISPIFQHRTQHNRIYYNNMTDLPTPNTTQPYILQQHDRSCNTEHKITVYITTIWPIFQHRTQRSVIYYNNIRLCMCSDLPTPNTKQT